MDKPVRTQRGRSLDELTMDAILRGELSAEDFHISAETLQQQAQAAANAGYPQLAENLLRAAELTRLSNEEVLAIYNKLRPGRTTYQELLAIAARLEDEFEAPLTAALVREAAEAYLARGLISSEDASHSGT